MPGRTWSVASAKAAFSEVLDEAQGAPQVIEKRGRQVAIVLGVDDYRELAQRASAAAPAARWRRFLRLSAELRAEGGAELSLPRRAPRRSPLGR